MFYIFIEQGHCSVWNSQPHAPLHTCHHNSPPQLSALPNSVQNLIPTGTVTIFPRSSNNNNNNNNNSNNNNNNVLKTFCLGPHQICQLCSLSKCWTCHYKKPPPNKNKKNKNKRRKRARKKRQGQESRTYHVRTVLDESHDDVKGTRNERKKDSTGSFCLARSLEL